MIVENSVGVLENNILHCFIKIWIKKQKLIDGKARQTDQKSLNPKVVVSRLCKK